MVTMAWFSKSSWQFDRICSNQSAASWEIHDSFDVYRYIFFSNPCQILEFRYVFQSVTDPFPTYLDDPTGWPLPLVWRPRVTSDHRGDPLAPFAPFTPLRPGPGQAALNHSEAQYGQQLSWAGVWAGNQLGVS